MKNTTIKIRMCVFLTIIATTCYCRSAIASSTVLPVISPPTILSTYQIEEGSNSQIAINGLANPGQKILVYINGKYDGNANISQIFNSSVKFSYLSTSFTSNQNFEVTTLAQDSESLQLSAPASAQVFSVIEKSSFESNKASEEIKPNPKNIINPPLLITPQQQACVSAPYISGFTESKTKALIYIDGVFFSDVPIINNASSSSFFSYTPADRLDRGDHSVFALAEDASGHKSGKSNILSFCISEPQIITAISTSSLGISNISSSSGLPLNSSATGSVFQKTFKVNAVDMRQWINVSIFIIFIALLILWMYFVNRRLKNDQKPVGTAENENYIAQTDEHPPTTKL